MEQAYKIRVTDLDIPFSAGQHSFLLMLETSDISHPDIAVRREIKKTLATLRKAIKLYRHRHERPYGYDWNHSETGNKWNIYRDVLLHFAEWFVFPEELSILIERADKKRLEQEEQPRFGFMGYDFSESFAAAKAFQLFELPQSATAEEIKKRYRMLALKHHPDTGGSQEAFIRVNNAYQVLSRWVNGERGKDFALLFGFK